MVVVNSSPIITLAKIGKLDLLHKLFVDVSITEQVHKEILSKPTNEETIIVKKAVEGKWIKVQKSGEIEGMLGEGESSSVSLSIKLKQPLIIDDRKAVFIANTFGVECHGTLYIVLLALKKGIIKNKKEAIAILNQLIENNLYLSSDALSEFYALLSKI